MPDDLLLAVCYIGVNPENGQPPRFAGTAYFVGVPLEEDPSITAQYLVTARHNLRGAEHEIASTGGVLCVRVNSSTGSQVTSFRDVEWLEPEDPGSDVAAMNWPFQEDLQFRLIPRPMWVNDQILSENRIGLGDELNMVGLFTSRAGAVRNQPIVRSGIISAEPSDPIFNTMTGSFMRGCYLAELRSIHGLSGSPVFVVLPFGRPDWRNNTIAAGGSSFYLLGHVHGHWTAARDVVMADYDTGGEEPLNTGIAIVTPIRDLAALLDHPTEVDKRRQMAQAARDGTAPPWI